MDILKFIIAIFALGLAVSIQIIGVVLVIWCIFDKLFNEEFAIFGISIYKLQYRSNILDCENHRTWGIITYDQFISEYLTQKNCHTYVDWGFLLDSDDYKVRNMVIGFRTKEDLVLYRKWYKNNKRKRRLK